MEWAHLVFLTTLVFHSYNADARPETISDPPSEAKLLTVGCVFVFFVSIYLLFCSVYDLEPFAVATNPLRRAFIRPVTDKCPILVYSTVKELKFGKATLECAICLNEFQHWDKIRLLPKCQHVFHTDCIDGWFLRNLNCPICRSKLTSDRVPDIAITIIEQQQQHED